MSNRRPLRNSKHGWLVQSVAVLQLHGHGTLVVAQYTSEGIAVATDSLQTFKTADGILLKIPPKPETPRKLFLMDKRTVCALTDLSRCTKLDGSWVDFSETVGRAALNVSQTLSDMLFQEKCSTVARGLYKLLQELSRDLAGYRERVLSILLFFGYQGQGARLGVWQFEHERENITRPRRKDWVIGSPAMWVFGQSKTIEARMATMGIDARPLGKALVYPIPDSSLENATSFVRLLVSESIEAEPKILGGPVQVATIPRDPKMEPTFSENR